MGTNMSRRGCVVRCGRAASGLGRPDGCRSALARGDAISASSWSWRRPSAVSAAAACVQQLGSPRRQRIEQQRSGASRRHAQAAPSPGHGRTRSSCHQPAGTFRRCRGRWGQRHRGQRCRRCCPQAGSPRRPRRHGPAVRPAAARGGSCRCSSRCRCRRGTQRWRRPCYRRPCRCRAQPAAAPGCGAGCCRCRCRRPRCAARCRPAACRPRPAAPG